MSDLERAMSSGGVPVPTPTGAQAPIPGVARQVAQKKSRKKSVKKAAKKRGVKKRKVGKSPLLAAPYGKKAKRAPRGSAVTMDLAGTMDLLGSMHRTDVSVFQVISEALSSRAKPSRRRLLAALAKVFG